MTKKETKTKDRRMVLKTFQLELTVPVDVWKSLSGDELVAVQEAVQATLQRISDRYNCIMTDFQLSDPY